MGLSLSTTTAGNHKVVAVAGDLDATTGEELRGELRMLLNDGACDLAVDIDRVEHADSAGLEALADPLKAARSFDGSLRLVCQDAALATEHRRVPGMSLQDDPRRTRCRRTAHASEFGSAPVNTKPRFVAGLTRRLPAALIRFRMRTFVAADGSAVVPFPVAGQRISRRRRSPGRVPPRPRIGAGGRDQLSTLLLDTTYQPECHRANLSISHPATRSLGDAVAQHLPTRTQNDHDWPSRNSANISPLPPDQHMH